MDTSLPKGGAGAHNWGSILENGDITGEGDEFEDQAAGGGKRSLYDVLLLYALG